ncbi:MAG: hypothetical protein IKK94_01145, partial [Clostridia bacterium]|nr:hypothetical protein [Clostridia bacterium]
MKRLKLIFMLVICMVILVSCENESVDTPVDTTASNSEEQEDVRYPSPVNDGEHPSLIAHAGGAVYGYRLTNSLEALDASYENGFRVFELDFEVTGDGEYVLLHDWESMAERMLFGEGKMTLDEFKNAEKFASLTLLSLDELLSWLSVHEDC